MINLDDTIAVTQNFCSSTNFDRVWVRCRSGRKKMSAKLLRMVSRPREEGGWPHLAQRARALNERDKFQMHVSEVRTEEERKARKVRAAGVLTASSEQPSNLSWLSNGRPVLPTAGAGLPRVVQLGLCGHGRPSPPRRVDVGR